MKSLNQFILVVALAMTLPTLAAAQEWTRFRGPNGTGIGDATQLPLAWGDEDYAWKVELPGTGHSSPVVWGERIFLTCSERDTAKRIVLCVNAGDGSIHWQREYHTRPYRQHADNNYAAATPTVDSERVYVTWTTPESCVLLALDHQGQECWRIDLGRYVSQHGSGVSPIVFEDLVILTNDQEGPESFIVAADCKTGQIRWKVPRRSTHMAASTPCLYQPPGQAAELITTSRSEGVVAFDPRTGRRLWQVADVFGWRVIASPVVAGHFIIGSCGEGAGGKVLVAVSPPAEGREAQVAWTMTSRAPYVPTPLAKGDLLFALADNGTLSCLRSATGEIIWQERIGGSYYSSPICVNGRLYCISKRGDVVVLSAAEKFEVLARLTLGELCYATPAVANGRLYIRTHSHLMCIAGKER